MDDDYKVAILTGGHSIERNVSLLSGKFVSTALNNCGINAIIVDPKFYNLYNLRKDGFKSAFITLHGGDGENGSVQSILENISLPYTGTCAYSSEITANKLTTEYILSSNNIPVVNSRFVILENLLQIKDDLKYPCILKPVSAGFKCWCRVIIFCV